MGIFFQPQKRREIHYGAHKTWVAALLLPFIPKTYQPGFWTWKPIF